VVALFNAITKHQKALADEQQAAVTAAAEAPAATKSGGAGGRSFLELLRQSSAPAAGARAGHTALKEAPAAETDAPVRPAVWSVLQEDFLENAEGEEDEDGGGGVDELTHGAGAARRGKGGKARPPNKRQAAAAAAATAAATSRRTAELPDILGDDSDDEDG